MSRTAFLCIHTAARACAESRPGATGSASCWLTHTCDSTRTAAAMNPSATRASKGGRWVLRAPPASARVQKHRRLRNNDNTYTTLPLGDIEAGEAAHHRSHTILPFSSCFRAAILSLMLTAVILMSFSAVVPNGSSQEDEHLLVAESPSPTATLARQPQQIPSTSSPLPPSPFPSASPPSPPSPVSPPPCPLPPPPPVHPPKNPPTSPPERQLCAALNERWSAYSQPTNDWSAAGVLVHVLDGGGVNWNGFINGPPDLLDPLRETLVPDSRSFKGSGRLSATLVNSRHPDVFRCFTGCKDGAGQEMVDLPGLVLSPSTAIQRRVNCMSWRDSGSSEFNCRPLGQADCIAGCIPQSQWHTPGGVNLKLWVERWGASQLEDMLRQQDENAGAGSCLATQPAWTCTNAWRFSAFYNEVVLDKFAQPWDAELTDMVDAVFVAPSASDGAMELARAVQADLERRFADKRAAPPLLFYDASGASDHGRPAFREVPPALEHRSQ